MEELQELTMISLNIRGFNSEEKHHVIGQLIHDNEYPQTPKPLFFQVIWVLNIEWVSEIKNSRTNSLF